MAHVKVWFYDIGWVLAKVELSRAFERFSASSGKPVGELRDIFEKSGINHVYEEGKISSEEFHSRAAALMGLRMGFSEFASAWCDVFTENKRETMRLARLKRYCRVFLLSNTNEMHYKFLNDFIPALRLADGAALSCRLGCSKPGKEIYEAALKLAGAAPDECVFVDDMPANVEGGRAAGIRSLLFNIR
ncbi:MAG: HAD family phosphatase [bacterium]